MPTAVGDILDLLWTVHDTVQKRKKKSRMRKKSIQASKEHIACIWEAAADVTNKRLLQGLLREPCHDTLAGEVNEHGMSILHVAAQRNNARFLQFFITQQDISSEQGFSLLQSRDNDGRLFYHPYGCSLVDVQILSSLKLKLTDSQWAHLMMLTANDGKTCFHHAAQLLQADAVELIVGSICSDKLWELLNKKDVKGLNPLETALTSNQALGFSASNKEHVISRRIPRIIRSVRAKISECNQMSFANNLLKSVYETNKLFRQHTCERLRLELIDVIIERFSLLEKLTLIGDKEGLQKHLHRSSSRNIRFPRNDIDALQHRCADIRLSLALHTQNSEGKSHIYIISDSEHTCM